MPAKITESEFFKRALVKFPQFDYTESTYINYTNEITIKCVQHGEFTTTPRNFLLSQFGCLRCGQKNSAETRTKSQVDFLTQVSVKFPELDFTESTYVNNHTKIQVRCYKHGCFSVLPMSLLAQCSIGCSKCANNIKKTTTEFIEEMTQIRPEYDYSKVQYVNRCTKVEVVCKQHGSFFSTPANLIFNKSGCPVCQQSSRLELCTEKMLQYLGVSYVPQKRFPNCKDKRVLPFDFYLPKQEFCIECQGDQHFEARSFYNKREGLVNRLNKDQIKFDYCKNNNISLILILPWYSDFRIYLELHYHLFGGSLDEIYEKFINNG